MSTIFSSQVNRSQVLFYFREKAHENAETAGLKAKDFILTDGTKEISLKLSKYKQISTFSSFVL